MQIVVHSKKYLFQQKFQRKLYYFNRNSQFRSVILKKIQLDIRSRTKDPTPTPNVVMNRIPPKNLRILRTPAPTPPPWFAPLPPVSYATCSA